MMMKLSQTQAAIVERMRSDGLRILVTATEQALFHPRGGYRGAVARHTLHALVALGAVTPDPDPDIARMATLYQLPPRQVYTLAPEVRDA